MRKKEAVNENENEMAFQLIATTNGNIYGVKLSTVLSLKKSCLSVLFVFYPKHFLPSSEREKNTLKTEQLAGHSLLANDYKVSF